MACISGKMTHAQKVGMYGAKIGGVSFQVQHICQWKVNLLLKWDDGDFVALDDGDIVMI